MSIKDKKLTNLGKLFDCSDSYDVRSHLSKLTCADLIWLDTAVKKLIKLNSRDRASPSIDKLNQQEKE